MDEAVELDSENSGKKNIQKIVIYSIHKLTIIQYAEEI